MAEYGVPEWLVMLSDLVSMEVRFGGREMPLLDLVDAWSQHVLRLYSERGESFDSKPDAWGVWDLGAAYLIRDAVSAALDRAGADEPSCLVAVDELLKVFTTERSPDWRALMNEERGAGWWWSRIPSSGPVLADYHAAAGT